MPETLKLRSESAVVEFAPWRGAIVTRFEVAGRAVLYLDENTLRDPSKNVRGGVPVLFPTPGKLESNRWSWRGHSGTLPQHGFARSMPWDVVEHSESEAVLRLGWAADEVRWPWPCVVELRYTLVDRTLCIAARVANHGSSAMPFAFGLHPYFAVDHADKVALKIPTPASRAFDNVTKREVELQGPIDLTVPEVDLHLIDHGSSHARLLWPGGRSVELRCSPELTRWVIWTVRDKAYVCLEPWSAPGNALNADLGLIVLEPDAQHTSVVEICATG